MQIRASVQSADEHHHAAVGTDGRTSLVAISGRPGGGSSVTGGELLCLALATCYCNDVYREAARRGIAIRGVAVEVEAEFGGPGEPARRLGYTVRVDSDAPAAEIEALVRHTDTVAEVHNTLRAGIAVDLRGQRAPTLGDD
jgi:uncharacterized OsmC-like protein